MIILGSFLIFAFVGFSVFWWHQNPKNSELYKLLHDHKKIHVSKIVLRDKGGVVSLTGDAYAEYLDSALSKSVPNIGNFPDLPPIQKSLVGTVFFGKGQSEEIEVEFFPDPKIIQILFPMDRLDDPISYIIFFDEYQPKELEQKLNSIIQEK
jgi:hypothetical protein